mgnify:CR=1 FL=1
MSKGGAFCCKVPPSPHVLHFFFLFFVFFCVVGCCVCAISVRRHNHSCESEGDTVVPGIQVRQMCTHWSSALFCCDADVSTYAFGDLFCRRSLQQNVGFHIPPKASLYVLLSAHSSACANVAPMQYVLPPVVLILRGVQWCGWVHAGLARLTWSWRHAGELTLTPSMAWR